MNLKELKYNWDKFGQLDPFWAVLSWNDKKGKKWKSDEFFATGQREIEQVLTSIKNSGIELSRKKALDFGCGVGRLTQALALHFDEVYGVDISPSMLKLAHKHNRYGSKCQYYLNDTDNLNLFQDDHFDLIYSNITLQHMKPTYSQKYIKEFLRVLSPQGLLIFQLPSEPKTEANKSNKSSKNQNKIDSIRQRIRQIIPLALLDLYRQIRYGQNISKRASMEMYGIRKDEVIRLIQEVENVELVNIKPNQSAGNRWISFQYWIRKA